MASSLTNVTDAHGTLTCDYFFDEETYYGRCVGREVGSGGTLNRINFIADAQAANAIYRTVNGVQYYVGVGSFNEVSTFSASGTQVSMSGVGTVTITSNTNAGAWRPIENDGYSVFSDDVASAGKSQYYMANQ